MRRLALRILIWIILPKWDRSIFWEATTLAERQILDQTETSYYGGTKHAIVYERIRTILVKSGIAKDEITGAVIHLAICLKYLQSR